MISAKQVISERFRVPLKRNIPGSFFAAGDVSGTGYRQAVTAAGSGCMASNRRSEFYFGSFYGAESLIFYNH